MTIHWRAAATTVDKRQNNNHTNDTIEDETTTMTVHIIVSIHSVAVKQQSYKWHNGRCTNNNNNTHSSTAQFDPTHAVTFNTKMLQLNHLPAKASFSSLSLTNSLPSNKDNHTNDTMEDANDKNRTLIKQHHNLI